MDFLKLLLISILFTPIVYTAVKHKRWYLYLAFGFVGILPDQFAIELSASIPLVSASRIMIVILIGVWMYERIKNRDFSLPHLSLLIFLAVNVVISIANLHYGVAGELKRVALLTLERVLLVIAAADLIRSREEFNRCIDVMIWGCVAMAVIGILQTAMEYDIASVLQVTVPRTNFQISDRMGMTRAFGTTNAIIYGCYCAFMSPIILYRLENTGKRRYVLAFFLNFAAMLCTMSRSAWLCMGAIVLVMLCMRRWKLLRYFVPYIPVAVVGVIALLLIKPNLVDAVVETVRSVLVAFGIKVDLSDGFGMNGIAPAYSRLFEWTIIQYMFMEGKGLFGYGYDSFIQGRLHYFYRGDNAWTVAKTLDVGLIGIASDGGILGLLTYVGLFGYILVTGIRNRKREEGLNFYKLAIYMVAMYFMLNYVAAFVDEGAVWLFIALFYAYHRLEKKNLPEK
jgi:hypothetical protein